MNKIKEVRKQLKLSQAEFADIAGCTAQYIGQLERGERRLHVKFLNETVRKLHLKGYEGVKNSDFLPTDTNDQEEDTWIQTQVNWLKGFDEDARESFDDLKALHEKLSKRPK